MIPRHVVKWLEDMRLEREAWERAHPYRAFWRRKTWRIRNFGQEIRFRLRVLIHGHECEP